MATLTYSDIQTRVADGLRIPTTNTTEMTKIAAVVNEVYRDIAAKRDWWWLRKRQVVNTVAPFETGTVAVTSGTSSITFSDAPTGLGSFAGRVLVIQNDTGDSGALFRVSTHTADSTSAVLDAAYTGDTAATATFTVWQDSYNLATDTGKVIYIKRYGYPWPMKLVGESDIFDLKIYDQSEGKPEVAAVIDNSTTGDPTTGNRQLVVHPFPDDTYRMEVEYKRTLNTEVSSTTRTLIPDDYVQVIVYGALARAFPLFLNDIERGAFYQGLYNDTLNLMSMAAREYGEDQPRIEPQMGYRQPQRRRRITAQRADLGSFFDRWPAEW